MSLPRYAGDPTTLLQREKWTSLKDNSAGAALLDRFRGHRKLGAWGSRVVNLCS
jgi:hypothetical protein